MFYRWVRDLHLYFGLFVSPFLLLFACSVFFLNHAKAAVDRPTHIQTISPIVVPGGLDVAQGPAAIALARQILAGQRIDGEIGFTRFIKNTRHFMFPVSKPGLERTVEIDVDARSAVITTRETGLFEAIAYLHKMPGPHNANIRGNWIWTRIWKPFADATIYLTLFISITGIYLWYAIRAERRVGIALLAAGAVTFFGLIYAVIR